MEEYLESLVGKNAGAIAMTLNLTLHRSIAGCDRWRHRGPGKFAQPMDLCWIG